LFYQLQIYNKNLFFVVILFFYISQTIFLSKKSEKFLMNRTKFYVCPDTSKKPSNEGFLMYRKSVLSITMENGLEFAEHKKVAFGS